MRQFSGRKRKRGNTIYLQKSYPSSSSSSFLASRSFFHRRLPSLAPGPSWQCRWRRRAFPRKSRRWTRRIRRPPISSRSTSPIPPPTASPRPDTPTTKSEWRPTCPFSKWRNRRWGAATQISSGFAKNWSEIPRSSSLPSLEKLSKDSYLSDRMTVFLKRISSKNGEKDWKDSSTRLLVILWRRMRDVCTCSCKSPSSTRTTSRAK